MSHHFDRVYFFGDSLSDTGNFLNFTGGTFPNTPYAPGRFSNGDIWVDYLSDELNITVDPLITGIDPVTGNINFDLSDTNDGINFAIGGATSGDDSVGVVLLGLEQQIDAFELLVESQSSDNDEDDEDDDEDDDEGVLNNDLSFLWSGANDYFSFIEDNPTTADTIEANFPDTQAEIEETVSEVVDTNIAGAIQDLLDAGGEEIVVFNLPNLDKTPLAHSLEISDRETLREITELHNDRLVDTLEDLEDSNSDVEIVHIDVDGLFDSILENPSAFGFTNVTDNYIGVDVYTRRSQPSNSGDPNEYLFWDSVHPTTAAHKLVADLVIDELTDEGLI